ncbi:hypothetical protein MHEL_27390 [Mycolicibacterium helvum]|uniref:Uncharacterized protein n=1 Tax=Mycolicibacterium helvum TaxID=1534349 RepID=A0A7I7T8M6_9MYCO|nr:hypothetical protein MHEL_27390 [Mycolicibacterium helvum]
MLFETGADGVKVVGDPALVGVVEERTDHRRADPELIGMQPEFLQDGDQRSHGSNAPTEKIPPTVAVMTAWDNILP